MDVIFATLPKYLEVVGKVFLKFGYRVFYLKLSGSPCGAEAAKHRAAELKQAGISPLPLENLPHFVGYSACNSDPDKKGFEKTCQLAPTALLQAFKCLYPNNADITAKLHSSVQSMVDSQISIMGRVNIWARAHPDRKHLLIYHGVRGFLVPALASNVRLWVVPVDIFVNAVVMAVRVLRNFLWVGKIASRPAKVTATHAQRASLSRVVFVTHAGLNYGNLFQKTLFYSDRTNSELHSENLLHFDYCGVPSPSEKLKWVCLGGGGNCWLSSIYFALIAVSKGILHVRSVQQIVGLLSLIQVYVLFKFYLKKLEAFPDLKVALIDYEVLCPKALLLAFEAKGIKTVAVQERFNGTFFSSGATIILNTYLCGSKYAAEIMEKSPFFHVDHYLPVGQYRSDYLVKARQSPPPILEAPIAQGQRIITALGFHTQEDWHNSQSDPLLNWTAHRHFLEDMVRLSKEIPRVFIILRYKTVDWVSLPVFAEIVQEIESMENMTISMDYGTPFFSYDLCAHSHLVIAQFTSLADECLAVGIPVLFHEYSHNTERIMADAFDYSPAKIMCFNHQELLERAQAILSGDPHSMTPGYEYLKSIVCGGLGDGKVQERIHAHIDSLLA